MKKLALLFSIAVLASVNCFAQSSAFTYQGKLGNSGMPASGDYQFEFKLFDASGGTNQVGSTQTVVANVQNGIFTTRLDFGAAAFPTGADRWLQINVRLNGSGDPYTVLSPRQQINSVPFAVRSLNSTTADALSSACAGCVTSTQIGSGSGNYVQNTTSPQAASNFNISGNGTAGGTLSGNIVNATTQYNLGGFRVLSNAGIHNFFAGPFAGFSNTTGQENSFFGDSSGQNNTTASVNSFFGSHSGLSNTTGSNNTMVGFFADVGTGNLTNATAIGWRALVTQNNSLVLGSINGVNGANANTNVGIGTTAPGYKLHVVGENVRVEGNNSSTFPRFSLFFPSGAADAQKWQNYAAPNGLNFSALNDAEDTEVRWLSVNRGPGLTISSVFFENGVVAIQNLGTAGSTQLCRNASTHIATCSSSLRYKTNITRFSSGLAFVNKLQPISFEWKDGGMKDVGFGAEDVAKIDPLFVTYNKEGQVEGVKYDRLSVAFVNAFKEQQAQIESQQIQIKDQQEQLKRQQTEVEALKKLICSQNSAAEICKPKN